MDTNIDRKYRIITAGLDDPICAGCWAVRRDKQHTGTQAL
jgi:hypothetical protein